MPDEGKGAVMSGSSRDYIPSNDGEFDAWFKNLVERVEQKTGGQTPVWTHIPAGEVTLLREVYTDWHAVYEPTLQPHLPAETLAKNEGRATTEGVIRPFVGQWLLWKQVSDKEREEMGVHIKKPRRDRIPAPSTVPELSPVVGHPRQIVVPYRDKGSARRGKPADVHGIELCWAILDREPSDENELIHSTFDTASPLYLNFSEQERGKRVYMAGRWEIEREGVKGDLGDIVQAIVP
jgi:hypothetical protein